MVYRKSQTLSAAVLDAALEGAKKGELLLSESLTVAEKVRVGKAAAAPAGGEGGGSSHWAEQTGKERLAEVMGRMDSERALLVKLLLR